MEVICDATSKRTNSSNRTNTVPATDIRPKPFATPIHMPESTSNPARWTYTRLAEYIQDFESHLDEDHEIGARLVSFGSTVIFHIQTIGYYGPDIITFDGVNDDGEVVKLIQNISQLSVLLVAMKKLHEKPRRIGFELTNDVNISE